MCLGFRYRKRVLSFDDQNLIVFYQIKEAVETIEIITQCIKVKPKKIKTNYFKIPNN
jgi:hypothetical protein